MIGPARERSRLARERTVAGGAGWRHVSGPALAAVFLVQAFTGLLLMTAYSPSSATAWGSVYYINNEMWLGWFIRGVHHYAAQATIALLAFHLLQVLWIGAYRRPREFTWWFGVVLLVLTVGFGHTGYQLPWDQKGYWATKVVTNIVGGVPVIGPYAQKLLVGGTEYGNQTLTRFFALHVAVLPSLFVAFLVAHIAVARRQGLTPPATALATSSTTTYWPHQSFRNRVFSAAVIGAVVAIALVQGGAHLDAPADPSSADYPARPEWYFLSLYQMLKYFPGTREVIGTFVIPSALLTILFLLPLFDRLLPRRLAHLVACGFVFGVVGGAGYLTARALLDDSKNVQFHEARKKADAARELRSSWPRCPTPASRRTGPSTSCGATRSRKASSCWSVDAWPATWWMARGRASNRRRTWRTTGPAPGSAACSRTRNRPGTSARCPVATA